MMIEGGDVGREGTSSEEGRRRASTRWIRWESSIGDPESLSRTKMRTAIRLLGVGHAMEDVNDADEEAVKGVGDDGGMYAGGEEGEGAMEEGASDDDDSGGAIAGDGVLGIGEINEHLGGGLEGVHDHLNHYLAVGGLELSEAVEEEEDPKPPKEGLPGRGLIAEVGHHPCDDHLLQAHPAKNFLQVHPGEGAVGVFLDHSIVGTTTEVREELGLRGAIKDEVVVPPLIEHGVVGGGGTVVMMGEEDGDTSGAAKGDGATESGEDGSGHGGEVLLHVNDEEGGGLRIGVSPPDLVLGIGGIVGEGRHGWLDNGESLEWRRSNYKVLVGLEQWWL